MIQQRLIEVGFPIREVSEESVREKDIRRGHISALHLWWARRPLAASRATALAALLPYIPEKREELENLISSISPWEVITKDGQLDPNLDKVRRLIHEAFDHRAPRVLDPFAGGGAIPLEALRLGCEVYALDYNPVATLLNKAVLEYPAKFNRSVVEKSAAWGSFALKTERNASPLLEAVKHWGNQVLDEVRRELAQFYPDDTDGFVPVGYIWAWTLLCQNPACGAEIPLMRQTWLARKNNQRTALRLFADKQSKQVMVKIVEGEQINFDPSEGTTSRAHVRCPVCGGTIDDNTTRQLFRDGKVGQRMMALVLNHPRRVGKTFRSATERDTEIFDSARSALEQKRAALAAQWGIEPVPDEPTPLGRGPGAERAFSIHKYGLTRWGDLFNTRQKLALVTFAEKVRNVGKTMCDEGADPEFAKAVQTYLALTLDKLAMFTSKNCTWKPDTVQARPGLASRQAIQMVWDYFELNPISGSSASWGNLVDVCLDSLSVTQADQTPGIVVQGTATRLPWNDDFFDAVLTDPPYYDNVPYSDLSDFFYVWLKRTIGDLYPDLFATPLAPKSNEMVADASRAGGMEQANRRFEEMFTRAFEEIRRVLKADGIVTVVFAHKTTRAWESVINALLKAGLYMTASWPIHTEMQARLRAQESGALASSIYMVCRKRTINEVAEFPKVRREIEVRIRSKLDQFWNEGIRGADFFMSAIGPAVEAFGKYARVEKLSGEPVTVSELLEYVRKVVSEFALERILKTVQLGGVDAPTRFYLLYRWTYNHTRIEFDEANKLAHGVGVELSSLWGPGGIVEKQKEYVQMPGPVERVKELDRKETFTTMLDALHYALYLWSRNEQKKLNEHLSATYGGNESFWQVAQAISEVLPEGDKEKQLLQGLLYGRKSYAAPEPYTEDMFGDAPKKRGKR